MKTLLCSFSGFKIYPGRGIKYVRVDSKPFTFIARKMNAEFLQKRNPRKIRWTLVYRRLHKKGSTEAVLRKKTRKNQKIQRAIVGASLEVIKQKREQKPEVRQATREEALRQIKEKKKAVALEKAKLKAPSKTAPSKAAPKKAASKSAPKTTPKVQPTKVQPTKIKQPAVKPNVGGKK